MLKVLYNEDSKVTRDDGALKIELKGMYCRAEVTDSTGTVTGFDVIKALRSYSSYTLVHRSGFVKVFRKISQSDYKFLDLNRLGVAIRMDFQNICQMYGDYDVMQLDTGIITPTTRDIIIRVFNIHKDNILVNADETFDFTSFSANALEFGDHPRFNLWDSYALVVNGRELKANRKGTVYDGDFSTPIVCPEGKDYMELEIRKYKGNFDTTAGPLTRAEDCEGMMVHASAGLLNATRVRLDHGVARVRFYPLGYTGEIKIKLGRKWYEVWNEYNLILGASK